MSDCDRCRNTKCDNNCQQDWCGSVEDVKYHSASQRTPNEHFRDLLVFTIRDGFPDDLHIWGSADDIADVIVKGLGLQ